MGRRNFRITKYDIIHKITCSHRGRISETKESKNKKSK